MNRSLAVLPLLLLLFISCKKNEPVVYPSEQLRLQRIKADDGRLMSEFSYDTEGRVLSQRSYSPGRKIPDETVYGYDGQTRVVKIETTTLGYSGCATCEAPVLESSQRLEYDTGGQLKRLNLFREDGTMTSYVALDYDRFGRVSQYNLFGAAPGVSARLVMRTTFSYDTRGNMTQLESFDADGTLNARTTYEYDNRPNPFQRLYLGVFTGLFRSPNNATRQKYEYFGPHLMNMPSPNSDRSTRYDYDPLTGYPVKAYYSGGNVSVFEYR